MAGQWDDLQAKLRAGTIRRRDFIAIAAALGVSSTLADTALAQVPKRGGHLIAGLNGAGTGDTLDTAFIAADYMNVVSCEFYDSLTVVDEHVAVKPALAESWETKAGAKEWVFRLRKGVTFHNGKTMTAADVVYSINHHRGKDTKSAAKTLVAGIADIKATGANEVTFFLESGNADWPYIMSDPHLCVVPEGSKFDGTGTGAFVLKNFEPGVRTMAERNRNDYRSDRGYVDSVETVAISDTAARMSALISGSVHLASKVDPNSMALLEKSPKVQIFKIAGNGYGDFGMWMDTAPYNDLNLRLALKYGIDREAILKTVLRGQGTLGNDHPIASFDPYFAADIPQRAYDVDKAKFHYAKAAKDAPIVLTVSDGAFANCVDTAQVMQASAAKAGIDLKVNRVPNDAYYSQIWLKNPFCAAYWGGRPTTDMTLSICLLSGAPWNETHMRDPKMDALLNDARSELDTGKRKQLYHDVQLMLYEQGGMLVPTFSNFIDAGSANLRGFVPTPTRQLAGQRAPEKVWFA